VILDAVPAVSDRDAGTWTICVTVPIAPARSLGRTYWMEMSSIAWVARPDRALVELVGTASIAEPVREWSHSNRMMAAVASSWRLTVRPFGSWLISGRFISAWRMAPTTPMRPCRSSTSKGSRQVPSCKRST
jgi:hypothetical protein